MKKTKSFTSTNDYDKLFPFIGVLFGNNPEWNNVTNYQKKKHCFITQRFMSIKHPDVANRFNINKINSIAVINLWKRVVSKYNRKPSWIYTKVKVAKKTKDFNPTEDTIRFYLDYHKISKRDLNDALKFNKDLILNELKNIEKIREENG